MGHSRPAAGGGPGHRASLETYYLHARDLIDTQGVAKLLGLARGNAVSTYQRRYPAMPSPIIDLGEGCCKLWRLEWFAGSER